MSHRCRDCGSGNIEVVGPSRQVCKILYADGRGEVTYPITPKVQLIFERVHKLSITKLNEGAAATNIYTLAHFVQSQNLNGYQATFPLNVEEWLDGVDAIEVNEESVVPFGSAPLSDGSLPSPSQPGSATAS